MSLTQRVANMASPPVEALLRYLDRGSMSRGAIIDKIPPPSRRVTKAGVGTTTFAEWCYNAGFFAGLLAPYIPSSRPLRVLDVGCGTGRLYLSAEPFFGDDDTYTGIDVNPEAIDLCRKNYPAANAAFALTEAANGHYAPGAANRLLRWPFDDDAFNLVTALSVWTHLREEDWRFYLNEVARVLAPDGRAMITFFLMDDAYRPERKRDTLSRFYPQPESQWIFDQPDTEGWFTTRWAKVPEIAIATPLTVFEAELAKAGLELVTLFPGQWKDTPGAFFQDVAVLRHRA